MMTGIIAFIIFAAVSVVFLIIVLRSGAELRRTIKSTAEDLDSALVEFRAALAVVRKVADDAAAVTGNVRDLTDTAVYLERGARQLYENYLDDLGVAAGANIAGLKAGVRTGILTLFRNISDRKEGSS
jgi:energy-converting hydrogenase Eha subunit H